MRGNKRWLGLILLLSLCLGGCASTKLSDAFDEEEVSQEAAQVVEEIVDDDYEAVEARFNTEMAETIPAGELQKALEPVIEELGEYQGITKTVTAGSKDKETEEELATVVVVAEFGNRKAQFTITFDTQMMLSGLYLK